MGGVSRSSHSDGMLFPTASRHFRPSCRLRSLGVHTILACTLVFHAPAECVGCFFSIASITLTHEDIDCIVGDSASFDPPVAGSSLARTDGDPGATTAT